MTGNNDIIKNGAAFECGTIGGMSRVAGHPLAVDGCLIMLCERGEAQLSVNSRRFVMRPGRMVFMSFDMVTVLRGVSADFEAKFLSVGFEAAQDIFFLVTSNRFWDFVYKSPVFVVPSDLAAPVGHWFALTAWLSANCPDAIRDKMMRNESENFIINMAGQIEARYGQLGASPVKNRAWALVNDFVALVERNYAVCHDVGYYADRLNVTPNYLNIITRRCTGTTAKEQINMRIGQVVKMLLDTTDLSVKQIAQRLHYDDPSYLCRIFRKLTGMSPIRYRNKMRHEPDTAISSRS